MSLAHPGSGRAPAVVVALDVPDVSKLVYKELVEVELPVSIIVTVVPTVVKVPWLLYAPIT